MQESFQMIERYSPPTEMDSHPYLTSCYCSPTSIWVQSAHDNDTPRWIEFCSVVDAMKFIEEKKNS